MVLENCEGEYKARGSREEKEEENDGLKKGWKREETRLKWSDKNTEAAISTVRITRGKWHVKEARPRNSWKENTTTNTTHGRKWKTAKQIKQKMKGEK